MEVQTIENSCYILNLTDENFYKPDKEVQILRMQCENLEEFFLKLQKIVLTNFPKCFIIQVDLKARSRRTVRGIKAIDEIKKSMTNSRPFLIQMSGGEGYTIYKQRNEDFQLIPFEINENIFSIEQFLSIQKCSIIKADYEKINVHLKEKSLKLEDLFLQSILINDELCFRILNLFKVNFNFKKVLRSIVRCKNFNLLMASFNKFEDKNFTQSDFESLMNKSWKEVKKIFKNALYKKEEEVLNFLLNYNQEKNFVNLHQKLNDEKIKTDEKIIKDLKQIEVFDDVKYFKVFIDINPNHKLCKGIKTSNPFDLAIVHKNFEAIAFLWVEKFISEKEAYDKSKELLTKKEQEKLRDEILKLMKKDPERYIENLLLKSSFKKDVKIDEIRAMLNDLKDVEDVQPILQIAALISLEFNFDLENENVKMIDPTRGESVKAVTYYERNILCLASDENVEDFYGTFVHELQHQIFYFIYDNDAKPFCKNDDEREKVWIEVRKETENLKSHEFIVSSAFNYPGYQWDVEVPVRFAHIAAKYFNDKEKFKELEEIFIKLANFHRNFVLEDLKLPNLYQIIKLNSDFGLLKKIQESKFEFNFIQDQESQSRLHLDEKCEERTLLLSNIPQMTLSKLFQEIFTKSSNKLHVKAKNIFIDFERLQQETLREELEKILNSSEILRIIIYLKVDDENFTKKVEKNLKFIESFSNSKVFLITLSNCKMIQKNLKFREVFLKFSWKDLTDKSRLELLRTEIQFREELFRLNYFYQTKSFLPVELLNILSVHKKPKICPKEPEKLKNYIDRKFLRKNENESKFYVDEFIKNSKSSRILLISDLAGSGKTTLLHKIHEILDKKFPNFWICFVSLREHKKLLEDHLNIGENFLELVTKEILNLNELEKKIFINKYESDQVVILFDGFDEVSPDCKLNALKVFKLHQQSGKSKIWITTRTHLEIDLEKELQVEVHKLDSLTEQEKIEFLCNYWQKFDSDLRQKCAKLLVNKISEMKKNPSLIGLFLQLRLLAKYFKEQKLTRKFAKIIKKLKMSQVYEFLIEHSVKFKEKKSIFNNSRIHMRTYETFALEYFLRNSYHKRFPHLFGLSPIIDELTHEVLEEFTRGGIISYDKNKKVYFTHQTFSEFLLSRLIEKKIYIFNKNWKYKTNFCDFIQIILCDQEFDIVRMFLDEAFEDAWKDIKNFASLKVFAETFYNLVIKGDNFNWFNTFSFSGFSHFTYFILECIKFKSVETFKKIIENNSMFSSFFSSAVSKINNLKILEDFIEKVFELYPENSELANILMRKNDEEETILHEIFKFSLVSRNFFVLWAKIKNRNFKYQEIYEILFHKDKRENIFLNYFLQERDKNENFEISAMIKTIKRSLKVEHQRKFIEEVKMSDFGNLKNEKEVKKVFEFLHEIFSEEEVFELLMKEDQDNHTIFHIAAKYSTREILKIIFEEAQFNKDVKKFILKRGDNGESALMKSVEKFNNFCLIWDEILPNFLTFQEISCETDIFGKNILHHLAGKGNFKTSKYFLDLAKVELSSELNFFLKVTTKYSENVFHLLAKNRNNRESMGFFFNLFSKNEMRIFLSQLDSNYKIPLHCVSNLYWCNEENFKFFYDFYEKVFTKFEILKLLNLKDNNEKKVLDLSSNSEVSKFIENEMEKLSQEFDTFSSSIFEFFPNNHELFSKLMEKDFEGCTIFHEIVQQWNFRVETFKKFWSKVEERNFENERFLEIFLDKDEYERIFLSLAINSALDDETNKRIDEVIKVIERNVRVEDKIKISSNFKLGDFTLYEEEKIVKVFENLHKIFENQEILEIFKFEDKNGNSIWHYAARNSSQVVLKIIFEEFQKFNGEIIFKKNKIDENVLMTSVKNENFGSFSFFFDQILSKFSKLKKILIETDEKGWNILHFLALSGNVGTLHNFTRNIKDKFEDEELKKFLQSTTKNKENIFHILVCNLNPDSAEPLIESLHNEELKELLMQFDSEEKLALHVASQWGDQKNFDLLLRCYCDFFNALEIIELFNKKDKNGKNVLELSRDKAMRNFLKNILNELSSENYDEENFEDQS